MNELPLMIFTLTVQAAIGAFLWATITRLRNPGAPAMKGNTLTALILTAIGMISSLVHLGRPYLAFTSLNHLLGSWLSREIFFSGAFFVLLLIAWLLERWDKAGQNLKTVWNILTSLAGLVAIFSMAKAYMATIYPLWQSWNTMVDFYATALILGAVLFLLTTRKISIEKTLRFDLIILAVVFIQIVFLPSFMGSLGTASAAAQQSAALLTGTYSVAEIARWILELGGVFLVMIARSEEYSAKASYFYIASVILILGVFLDRYLFYATGVATGIGLT